jgi:hypothetical protein
VFSVLFRVVLPVLRAHGVRVVQIGQLGVKTLFVRTVNVPQVLTFIMVGGHLLLIMKLEQGHFLAVAFVTLVVLVAMVLGLYQ